MIKFFIKNIISYFIFFALVFSTSVSRVANAAEELNLVNPGYLTDGNHLVAGIFNEEDGEYKGVFAEIYKTLLKRMGLKAKVQWYDFAALIPGLRNLSSFC